MYGIDIICCENIRCPKRLPCGYGFVVAITLVVIGAAGTIEAALASPSPCSVVTS
jgi:hypothetical protein